MSFEAWTRKSIRASFSAAIAAGAMLLVACAANEEDSSPPSAVIAESGAESATLSEASSPSPSADTSPAPSEETLLASLPDKRIELRAQKSDGVTLTIGDESKDFDWLYMTPRAIAPELYVRDFDGDGFEELAVILNIGSGTGVSVYELHMIGIDRGDPDYFADRLFKPDSYLDQLARAVTFKKSVRDGELTGAVAVGGKTSLVSLRDYQDPEYGTFKDSLWFGSIVSFESDGERLLANFGAGMTSDKVFSAIYIGKIFAEVAFDGGEFKLENLRFEPNPEGQG